MLEEELEQLKTLVQDIRNDDPTSISVLQSVLGSFLGYAPAILENNVGIKYRLSSIDNIVVPDRYQYITKGAVVFEPGASLTVEPGGQLVVI
jgi:hypothetical protein